MSVAIIFIALFASVYGVFYLYINTRNRERMAMIEKGIDTALFSSEREPKTLKARKTGSGIKFTLKSGMLIIGVGIGFVVSVLFNGLLDRDVYPLLVIGVIFICGGAGLVSGFYMGRNLEKKDVVE